jgi:hypothetical protein
MYIKKLKTPKINIEKISIFMLLIALFTFMYTVYRYNVNEENQTQRNAGFQMLIATNKLQSIIDNHYFNKKNDDAHYLVWSKILYIEDLSFFMNNDVKDHTKNLKNYWHNSANKLNLEKTNKKMSFKILKLKDAVKKNITSLN